VGEPVGLCLTLAAPQLFAGDTLFAGGIGRTEQFTPVLLNAPVAPGIFLDLTIADHNGRQLLAA